VIGVVRFAYLLALGIWIGEIAFFSFVVAPAIFGVLGPERAGPVVGAIFPRYYALGGAAAAVALGCGVVLGRRAATSGWWSAATLSIAVGLAATLWAATVVHPRAQRLRVTLQDAGQAPAANPDFQRAHRTAVLLNATALIAGVAGLGLSAAALRQ
jgi:uncharacterized membrane protein